MTHMHIPTVPTARDRRLAAQVQGKVGVWSGGGTSPVGYVGRHRAHRRDCAPDWVNTARCGSKSDPWENGCSNSVCPKHQPEAYAECMARHTPESLVERAGKLVFLGEYVYGPRVAYGTLDVNL